MDKENINRYERLEQLSENDQKYLYHKLLKKVPNVHEIGDILGQDKNGVITPPSKIFKFNIWLMGRLLSNIPERVTSRPSIWFRKKFIYKWAYANCTNDTGGKKHQIMKDAEIPKDRPIIFVPNHYSRDDAAAGIMMARTPAYLVFGGLPYFFQTTVGIEAWANGVFLVNRKDKRSRASLNNKIAYAFKKGLPAVLYYSEASLNRTPNKLMLHHWKGPFELAKKTGALVVPIINLTIDDTIYSSRLEAIDFSDWDESDAPKAMEYLRNIMANELFEMLVALTTTPKETALLNGLKEFEPKITREDIFLDALEKYKGITRKDIEDLEKKYPHLSRQQIIEQLITLDEIWEKHIEEQLEPIGEYYDYEIETSAHFQPKDVAEPMDVWDPVIKATTISEENNNILKRIPKDYQRKY